MSQGVKTWLADLAKWTSLILLATIAFYVVCPKHHFIGDGTRCNMVTGDVKYDFNRKGEWKTWVEAIQDGKNRW